MAIDMRKVAPSRLSKRQRMAILNFKGVHNGTTMVAFAQLVGGETWDVLNFNTAVCIRLRE